MIPTDYHTGPSVITHEEKTNPATISMPSSHGQLQKSETDFSKLSSNAIISVRSEELKQLNHGKIPTEKAERILKRYTPSAYLIRESNSCEGFMVVSCKVRLRNNEIQHFLFKETDNGSIQIYGVQSNGDKSFVVPIQDPYRNIHKAATCINCFSDEYLKTVWPSESLSMK